MKSFLICTFGIVIALLVAMCAVPAVAQSPNPKTPSDPTATVRGGANPPNPADAADKGSGGANQPPPNPTGSGGTNQSPPKTSLQWRLGSAVSPWNLTNDRWSEMTVAVAEGGKTKKIRLSQSTLVDTTSPGGAVLRTNSICLHKDHTNDDKCAQEIDVDQPAGATAASEQTLWMYVDDKFTDVGTFTGSLFFDTDPLSDTQSIALTVQQTHHRYQVLGVVAITLGVFIAWLVTIFGKSRIARDQAMMPALLLRDKLMALQTAEGQFSDPLKAKMAASPTAISKLLDSLSITSLDNQNFLPSAIPLSGPSATKTTDYQAFLTIASQKVEDLDIIVSEGLQLLAKRWNANLSAQDLADLQTAFGTIDQLSNTLPILPQTLRGQVNDALTTLNAAHAARAQALGVQPQVIPLATPGEKSFIAVRLEVQSITVLFWLIWGLLSVVVGATVLILPVPGFGSIADFVRCFLWGFGLPVAGNSIQNLTVGSLNTQLGVSVTRN